MAKPTAAELELFFTASLKYEIEMLRETYTLLFCGAHFGRTLNNCLIEAFSIHARNLIEFFKTKKPCDFDPRDFATPTYKLDRRFLSDKILPMINEQVAHLSANRTIDPEKKFKRPMWTEVFNALEGEIARLKANLKQEWEVKRKF